MTSPRIPVAREGYPFIFFAAFVTLISAILGTDILTWVCLGTTTFVVAFFRDPERMTPAPDNAIISPADGKIIIIEEQFDDKYLNTNVLKVSIFMNVFNVHVNRIPFNGTVKKVVYTPGKFYSADSTKGALLNENCAVILDTDNGKEFVFVQVAGLIARRIVNWLEAGDSVNRGKRFGLIRFGSRVDLYLPVDTEISVSIGDKVSAGVTEIATLSQG